MSSNPFEMFETDEKLEQDGIIVDYGAFRIRIAHAGGSNKKFSKLLNARLKPYERQLAAGTMDDDVAAKILREVYADTIILDADVLDKKKKADAEDTYTQGIIIDRKGTVAPFSKENVVKLFTALPKLFTDLKKQAEDFALFRVIEQEESAKK